jgi:hypothetical protein
MRNRKFAFAAFVTLSVMGMLPMLYAPASPVASTPYLSPMADVGVDTAWADCNFQNCFKIFHGPWICQSAEGPVNCTTDGVTCTSPWCN